MNNDFTLVFQYEYDEEQPNARSADKKIKRIVEEQGGFFENADEMYGMVSVVFKFSGTPEKAQKIGDLVVDSSTLKSAKMTAQIIQKYNVINIENTIFSTDTLAMNEIKDIIRISPMSHIIKNETNSANINIMIAVKEQYEDIKEKVKSLLNTYNNSSVFYDDSENKVVYEGNNYSTSKKRNTI